MVSLLSLSDSPLNLRIFFTFWRAMFALETPAGPVSDHRCSTAWANMLILQSDSPILDAESVTANAAMIDSACVYLAAHCCFAKRAQILMLWRFLLLWHLGFAVPCYKVSRLLFRARISSIISWWNGRLGLDGLRCSGNFLLETFCRSCLFSLGNVRIDFGNDLRYTFLFKFFSHPCQSSVGVRSMI